MKVLILLSGCGVYDGTEIHESVLTLYSLNKNGIEYYCTAPNKKQLHVIDHITGKELNETRNVLIESARIARGNVIALDKVLENSLFNDYDGLVIPGGFGAAKNLNLWAINGPDGEIDQDVKSLILEFIKNKKPILALCMGPTVLAKALEGSGLNPILTVGTDKENSPYDIEAISNGMVSIGVISEMKTIKEICVDEKNKIVTAPCYMMDATIIEVANNIELAVNYFKKLI